MALFGSLSMVSPFVLLFSQSEKIWWSSFADSTKSAVNVEATAYALLTMAKLNKIDQDKGNDKDRATALNIVRWIAQQRNSKGGFVSTQVMTGNQRHALPINKHTTLLV